MVKKSDNIQNHLLILYQRRIHFINSPYLKCYLAEFVEPNIYKKTASRS